MLTLTKPRLTAQDRCDRNQSEQARFIATKGEQTLIFCKHHADKYGAELTAQGWKLEEAKID